MTEASLIIGIRARGIASTDISDPNLTIVLAEALYEYSRYRPLIAVRTFETVADQQAYTKTEMGDTSLTRVIDVLWNPWQTGDEWDAALVSLLGFPRDAGDWHFPSLIEVDNIKAGAWNKTYGGSWHTYDLEGGSVYLDPMPSESGDTVYLIYEKSLSTVADIKDVDRPLFLDLVEAMCADRLANEISTKANPSRVRTPEYEIEVGAQIGAWRTRGKGCRARFVSLCNAGRPAAQRS